MNDWWEDIVDKISIEKIGCAIVIGVLVYGLYWFIFQSSTTTKIMVGVLVAAIAYIVYNPGSGGGSTDSGEGSDEDF